MKGKKALERYTPNDALGVRVEARLWEFFFLCYIPIKLVMIHIAYVVSKHTHAEAARASVPEGSSSSALSEGRGGHRGVGRHP